MKSSNSTLDVGFVLRAHGLRGELRVRSTAALDRFTAVQVGGQMRRLLEARAEPKGEWLLKLEGIGDRDAAERLRGASVTVERALVPLDEGELFVADLVGCRLFDGAGAPLGEVTGSFDSGAHEVLEVRGEDGREFMVPFVAELVRELDLAGRRIVCELPPGLIDVDDADDKAGKP